MNFRLLAACLTVAAGIAGGACAADPSSDNDSIKVMVIVSSHGLDLTTDAGASQFLTRLSSAIDKACNDRPQYAPPLRIGRTAAYHTCRAHALDQAMAEVKSPLVKRRYATLRANGDVSLARR